MSSGVTIYGQQTATNHGDVHSSFDVIRINEDCATKAALTVSSGAIVADVDYVQIQVKRSGFNGIKRLCRLLLAPFTYVFFGYIKL